MAMTVRTRKFRCVLFGVAILEAICTSNQTASGAVKTQKNPLQSLTNVFNFAVRPEYHWQLRTDSYSQGTLSFVNGANHKGVAQMTVTRFVQPPADDCWVNLNSKHAPLNFSNVHTLHFRMKAVGLSHMRVHLWNTSNEDWTSSPLATTKSWQTVTIPIKRFEQYTLSPRGVWIAHPNARLGTVTLVSFQVGTVAKNKIREHGTLSIADIGFD